MTLIECTTRRPIYPRYAHRAIQTEFSYLTSSNVPLVWSPIFHFAIISSFNGFMSFCSRTLYNKVHSIRLMCYFFFLHKYLWILSWYFSNGWQPQNLSESVWKIQKILIDTKNILECILSNSDTNSNLFQYHIQHGQSPSVPFEFSEKPIRRTHNPQLCVAIQKLQILDTSIDTCDRLYTLYRERQLHHSNCVRFHFRL